jgi:hypothetical protein
VADIQTDLREIEEKNDPEELVRVRGQPRLNKNKKHKQGNFFIYGKFSK